MNLSETLCSSSLREWQSSLKKIKECKKQPWVYMWDNQFPEHAETTIKDFLQQQLKFLTDAVNSITFYWIHRLERKKPYAWRLRPIIAKFKHFKQKELRVEAESWGVLTTASMINSQTKSWIHAEVCFPSEGSLSLKNPGLWTTLMVNCYKLIRSSFTVYGICIYKSNI